MNEHPIVLVDAFTRTPGEGNRAGVVVGAEGPDETAMLRIAKAVAASETAFVLHPTGTADLRLRYFTPATEVPFCGHATVATAHRLAETARVNLARTKEWDVLLPNNKKLYVAVFKR